MSVYGGPNVKINNNANINGLVTDQLQLHYDSARSFSYSGSGATWTDLSGNGRNLTLYNAGGNTYSNNAPGAPTFTTDSLGVFTFDGTNDWGKFPAYNFPSNVSVTAWVKTTSSGTGKGIIAHCSGGPVGLVYGIDSGKMWYYYYSGAWLVATSTSSINDGTWKNLVWTKAGTSMKMYINGVLDTTVTLTADVFNRPMNCIGSSYGPCSSDSYGAGTDYYSSVFPGSISFIMVHSKELSADEVAQNYNNTRRRYI